MWEYRATAAPGTDYVHDGDTVRLLIDTGFEQRVEKWIRLADVHAPELNQFGGTTARLFVRDQLSSWILAEPGRWPLRVVTEVTTRAVEQHEVTSLDRYVGWIYEQRTGRCLNEIINAWLAEHPEWPTGKAL